MLKVDANLPKAIASTSRSATESEAEGFDGLVLATYAMAGGPVSVDRGLEER